MFSFPYLLLLLLFVFFFFSPAFLLLFFLPSPFPHDFRLFPLPDHPLPPPPQFSPFQHSILLKWTG
jgi:hypothetical protein